MQEIIKKLPQNIINQIAAGEVVERPANMVKELVENALDSGADKVEIHFSAGGRFVHVKDNGCGIQSKELDLALSPHSTSKLASIEDLWNIHSYGFRGEALASIAEVSNLTLISKPSSQDQANRLKSAFGKKQQPEKIGAMNGTTVIVEDLFKNIPARMKFLKSEASETNLIKSTLKALALFKPQVEFRILHNNKLLFYWPKIDNQEYRVQAVLGLKHTSHTKTKYMNTHVEAVLCAPNETLSTRRMMWFFVNNRWVEDSTLYSAVMSAYRGLLMHGEYPIVALNINCPSEDLDVNVHPSKSKVRFKNPSAVFRAVHHSLRALLEKAPWTKAETSIRKDTDFQSSIEPKEKELSFPIKKNTQFHKKHFSFNNYENKEYQKGLMSSAIKDLNPTNTTSDNEPVNTETLSAENLATTPELSTDTLISESGGYWSSLYVLCQAHLTYILTQSENKIIFIDQHAAHERILYERLMLIWNKGKGDIQNRLIPLCLDMEESTVEALLSIQTDLNKLGLKLERSGPSSLVIHAAPCLLKDLALQKSLMQLGEEIKSEGGSFALEKKVADLCATMACHSAIRAGKALSIKEMQILLNQMDEFPLSSFCPHGRPVFVEYPLSRLEKDFGRRT